MSLDCRYVFNSSQNPLPPDSFAGEWIDLAQDPSSAHRLIKLGLSPRSDLPVVLLEDAGGKLRVLGARMSPEEAGRLVAGEGLPFDDLILYGASWCPDCRRAKQVMESLGVAYREVNLDEDVEAEARVLARSGGRRVIPTLELDGRLWTFNPDLTLLKRVLSGGSRESVAS